MIGEGRGAMTVQAIASQTSSDYLFWNVPVALSTNMLVDSASPDREKCGFTSDVGASFATGQSATKIALRRCSTERERISANC